MSEHVIGLRYVLTKLQGVDMQRRPIAPGCQFCGRSATSMLCESCIELRARLEARFPVASPLTRVESSGWLPWKESDE